jgi:hypothetical protein
MPKVQPFSLILILLAITGCSDNGSNSKAKQNDKNAQSNIMETKVTPPPQNDPVEEFRKFVKAKVLHYQEVVKGYNKLEIASPEVDGIRELEIDGDYIIDVKKSDSLIFPFIGEIKLKRRELYTGQINGKQFYKLEAPWTTVTIECVFEDGGWKEKNKEEGTFNLIRKGK